MRKIGYSVMGLFIVSLVFAAGNSFSQSRSSFGVPSQSALGEYGKGPEVKLTPVPFSLPGGGGTPVLYGRPSDPKCVVSRMISSELKSPQGTYLAEISDLVIDPANGHVSNVVLARVRGMGSKDLVIPFSAVTKTGEAIYLYNVPEDVYQFIGEAPYRSWGLNLHSEQKPTAGLTASKLIGAMVRTSKGEDLGHIEDLVIDHMGGHVVNLVVSGTGGKPVTVPFSALSESDKGAFILKTT